MSAKASPNVGGREAIDFGAIAGQVDLRRILEADLGQPLRGRRWACPFHPGAENPNFAVSPDGRRWRCWSCGLSGDVFDYIARRDEITVAEAARLVDPYAAGRITRAANRPSAPTAKIGPRAWEDADWQREVDAIVCRAEETLWSKAGRPALDWLRARGLADATLVRFRLGFLSEGARSVPLAVVPKNEWNPDGRIQAPRGITIPWVRPESWYTPGDDHFADPGPRWVGCNVRRLAHGDVSAPLPGKAAKYRALEASERGHPYPLCDLAPGVPALLCEGEFDTLLAWQEAGWVVNAVTVGGAQQRPQRGALTALAACPEWLLLFDRDEAGNDAARSWWQRSPSKAKRALLPCGKDLGDFVRDGGSVLGWLAGEFERLGWRWPLKTTEVI